MTQAYRITSNPEAEIKEVTDRDGWSILASVDNCHMIVDRLNEQHAEIQRLRAKYETNPEDGVRDKEPYLPTLMTSVAPGKASNLQDPPDFPPDEMEKWEAMQLKVLHRGRQ